jgi:hypothetical protein
VDRFSQHSVLSSHVDAAGTLSFPPPLAAPGGISDLGRTDAGVWAGISRIHLPEGRAMSRYLRLTLAVFALHSLMPLAAAAQLGGLTKKVKKAAEGAVEGVVPFTPQPAPEFSDRVLEITPDRLAGLLKGFEAEAANAKTAKKEYEDLVNNADAENAAYEAAKAAYDRNADTYRACASKFREAELKKSVANEAQVEKVLAEMNTEEFDKYMEDLAMRGEALATRANAGLLDPANDREWQAYAKEITAMKKEQDRRMKAAMSGMAAERERARTEDPRLVQACGPEPKAPAKPFGGVSGPEGILQQHGATAANLGGGGSGAGGRASLERYSIMRERVLNWVAEKQRPSQMGFSSDEIKALEAQADAVNDVVSKMKKAGVPL